MEFVVEQGAMWISLAVLLAVVALVLHIVLPHNLK